MGKILKSEWFNSKKSLLDWQKINADKIEEIVAITSTLESNHLSAELRWFVFFYEVSSENKNYISDV